ncbi:hypothetical protein AVEN_258720-1 [Araneus ventricosus]|uniref:Endonuclease/exonuclease/phosphatase domain-containing protein n=1 Tax=Araneus ventricosus TaxID=182803 RepID=A0A4Y2LLW5_ARAVE|nr:hypothetical protein AVEN_258720-1 [Araneus ventricosus]
MDKLLKTGTLKRSASRNEIRTTDLAAMEITVDQQDDNHELQRTTDWPVQKLGKEKIVEGSKICVAQDLLQEQSCILLQPVVCRLYRSVGKYRSLDALPTFQRNSSVGWPDLTLCSQSLIDSSINWEVLEEISLSDHRYIETAIASTVANQFYKRYKTRHGNHLRFLNILGKEIYHLERKIKAARNSGELNNATIELQTLIINAWNKSFKIKKQLLITKPNWWTEQLEIHKKKVRALRRRAQRALEIERQARYQVFKKEKAKYKRHIKKARNMGWRKFCSAASHPYGKQYKAAFRKSVFPSQIPYLINGDPKGSLQEAAQNILEQIFLSPAIPTNYNLTTSTQPPDPPFSPQEISAVIEHLPSGKAPGIDGIDNLLIKIIHKRFNNIFPTFFNKCLHLSCFPDSLKIGNIILFQKGEKD